MRLIEGIHACDSQIYALQRLARVLGITEAGEALHCGAYGYGATRWCELRWQDADDLEHGLQRIVERDAWEEAVNNRDRVGVLAGAN